MVAKILASEIREDEIKSIENTENVVLGSGNYEDSITREFLSQYFSEDGTPIKDLPEYIRRTWKWVK